MNRGILFTYAHHRCLTHRSSNHGIRFRSPRDGLGSWLSTRPTYCWNLLQATGGESAGIAAYRPAMFYSGSLTVASCLMIIGMKFKTAKSLRMKM
jgi:hypothetical protein